MPTDEPKILPKEDKLHRSEPALAYRVVKQAVLLSLVVGLVGGGLGAHAYVHYFAGTIPVAKQQLIVQENSAVIEVAKKASPTVVSITSRSTTRNFFGRAVQQEGAGTGIIVSADGLILTNKHVVGDANATYTVITSDGKEYANARVVSRDSINDIAFVRISASGLPVAELGDSGAMEVGQRVVAIGNALGQFKNTVTEGIISGLGRPIVAAEDQGAGSELLSNLLQTDAAINPGNSGGPLMNLRGQVIGINTAVAGQDSQNIGFAIPINDAKPLIASVKDKGRIIRPYLGVRYVALTKEVAGANDLKVTDGAWLQGDGSQPSVIGGSPAANAGLKEGDIITKIGDQKIDSTHSLQSVIGAHKVGEKVRLTIVRDGKTQTVEATLGEAPAAS